MWNAKGGIEYNGACACTCTRVSVLQVCARVCACAVCEHMWNDQCSVTSLTS